MADPEFSALQRRFVPSREHHFAGAMRVLENDPDLARRLEPRDAIRARHLLTAPFRVVEPGPWVPPVLDAEAERCALGVLIVDGVLLRHSQVERRHGVDILAAGDIVRPWQSPGSSQETIVPVELNWTVLESARLALLDRAFCEMIVVWPAILAELMCRVSQRARSLEFRLAVVQEPKLTERLMLVFWHLAERFGRVEPAGVRLALKLSHEILAVQVCAQRPSVTVALGQLSRQGLVSRSAAGHWRLHGPAPQGLAEPVQPVGSSSRGTLGTAA